MTPFIEALNPNSIVIVEETRKTMLGTKKYKLAMTKAPFKGELVHTFLNGKPNSSRPDFQEDDPLHLWFVNDEWQFFEDGKNEWINEKLVSIFWELGRLTTGSTNYQPMTEMDKEWWEVIQRQFKFREDRFIKSP